MKFIFQTHRATNRTGAMKWVWIKYIPRNRRMRSRIKRMRQHRWLIVIAWRRIEFGRCQWKYRSYVIAAKMCAAQWTGHGTNISSSRKRLSMVHRLHFIHRIARARRWCEATESCRKNVYIIGKLRWIAGFPARIWYVSASNANTSEIPEKSNHMHLDWPKTAPKFVERVVCSLFATQQYGWMRQWAFRMHSGDESIFVVYLSDMIRLFFLS